MPAPKRTIDAAERGRRRARRLALVVACALGACDRAAVPASRGAPSSPPSRPPESASAPVSPTAASAPPRAPAAEPPEPIEPVMGHDTDGYLRFGVSAVPDAARRARFDTLVNAFQWRSLDLCGDCRPSYDDEGNELPSEFRDRRTAMVEALSPEDRQEFIRLLVLTRATVTFDGHGQSFFEEIFFEPQLQPEAMRGLLDDLAGSLRRQESPGVHLLALLARDGPPECAGLFREIVRWPCAWRSVDSELSFSTLDDKTLAAAALTRVGTRDDVGAATAALHACADTPGLDWYGTARTLDDVRAVEQRLGAAPADAAAWRAWFDESFGGFLESD